VSGASLSQRALSEALGSALLLATIVGSGIMAERLAGGNAAIALLGNTLPTGAMLAVLITILGPISGAHLNPAVSMVLWLRGNLDATSTLTYLAAQIAGAIAGVLLAHAMFELPLAQLSIKNRSGLAQGLSEGVATFGLVLTILLAMRFQPRSVAISVGLYITAAYWFTASTSFANPAVTIARSLTDTFAGIHPQDVGLFIAAQIAGALCGLAAATLLLARRPAIDAPASAALSESEGL